MPDALLSLIANTPRRLSAERPVVLRRRLFAASAFVSAALLLASAPLTGLVLGLLASSAAALILARPVLGLALVGLALPFGSLMPLGLAGADGVDALIGFTLLAWLARQMAGRAITLRSIPLMGPLLLFLWVAALSLTQAISWHEGVTELLKWVEFALLYWLAGQMLTIRTRGWIVAGMLLAGISQAALGGYQFFTQAGPPSFAIMGRFLRAYGTFRQPNPYAGYLGYLTPVALSLALGSAGAWWQKYRTRATAPEQRLALALAGAAAASTTLLGMGILMSWSRGAWLGLAASTITVLSLRSRRAAIIAAGVGLALLTAVLWAGVGWLPHVVSARLADLGSYATPPDPTATEITDENFSVLERLAHWDAGLAMFSDHPWLGVGIGNYGVNYPAYAPTHWYDPLGHAHNVAINLVAETGALGAAAFGGLWIAALGLAWRYLRRGDPMTAAVAIGVLGVLVQVSVHNMFDNVFVQHMQLQLALLLGVLISPKAQRESC